MIGSEEKTVKGARKGAIMTTGGFEFNEDLKNAYLKCYRSSGWLRSSTRDGIIKMVYGRERSCIIWTWRSPYPWDARSQNEFLHPVMAMPANSLILLNVNRSKRAATSTRTTTCRRTTAGNIAMSFDDSIDDSTASRQASSTRPASTPRCPPARAISSKVRRSLPATCPMRSAHGTLELVDNKAELDMR